MQTTLSVRLPDALGEIPDKWRVRPFSYPLFDDLASFSLLRICRRTIKSNRSRLTKIGNRRYQALGVGAEGSSPGPTAQSPTGVFRRTAVLVRRVDRCRGSGSRRIALCIRARSAQHQLRRNQIVPRWSCAIGSVALGELQAREFPGSCIGEMATYVRYLRTSFVSLILRRLIEAFKTGGRPTDWPGLYRYIWIKNRNAMSVGSNDFFNCRNLCAVPMNFLHDQLAQEKGTIELTCVFESPRKDCC